MPPVGHTEMPHSIYAASMKWLVVGKSITRTTGSQPASLKPIKVASVKVNRT